MTIAKTQQKAFRLTGLHMLACFIAFFGTIIAVNITMAFLAAGSWTGLVVKNSYVASQKFNVELSQAKRQAELGLSSNITFEEGRMVFSILDANGSALTVEQATATIGRPAFEQQDRMERATCSPKGQCSVAAKLATGPWVIRIDATTNAGQYRRDARLLVMADGSFRVE